MVKIEIIFHKIKTANCNSPQKKQLTTKKVSANF